MRLLGRTERRVVLAILITALIPLAGALLTSRAIIARVSATAFQPEFGAALDQSLGVYADLVKAIKQAMRYEAEAIAGREPLRRAAQQKDAALVRAEVDRAFDLYPSLASLRVELPSGEPLAEHARAIDPAAERTLTLRRSLGGDTDDGAAGDSPVLVVTFATPLARLSEMASTQELVQAYHQLEKNQREAYLDETYQSAFAALLLFTIAVAVVAGVLVVRPVTTRIARLAAATLPVAAGDLSVRVPERGNDEVADLARAFNRMLGELDQSRARIEFLRRMSEWQKMARHLAHEIKNPLTPIQLAVEECHRRYEGDDPAYRKIVQTMFEVVSEEVATLRRLVSEFASFARLPRAELAPADLGEFLREQADHFTVEATPGPGAGEEAALLSHVELSFRVADGPMPAVIDREMLHRVLANVVRNAAQALRDAQVRKPVRVPVWGRVEVALAAEGESFVLSIDDDGPGLDPEIAPAVFDPYVTTKHDGTGLGLSIVKKVVMDHGGTIDAGRSPLGGARFAIKLPRAGTAAADAAMASEQAPPSEQLSVRRPASPA